MNSQNLMTKSGVKSRGTTLHRRPIQKKSPDRLLDNYDPLERIRGRAGDLASAAECATVIQREGLLHRRNESRRVQTFLRLQRLYGNQFVQRVIAQHAIQAKLKIGQPGDIYEQEADQLAEQVMKMAAPRAEKHLADEQEEQIQPKPVAEQITPLVQRQTEEEEEKEELQMKASPGQTPHTGPDIESRINAMKGGGQPLSPSARAFFEPRFGCDFSGVRVHADSEAAKAARSLNARAFTVGKNIIFGAGQHSPEMREGKKLLGHELTHVVQQGRQSLVSNLFKGGLIQRSNEGIFPHVGPEPTRITHPGATIRVPERRKRAILQKAGWRQTSVIVVVRDYEGAVLSGETVLVTFKASGVSPVREEGVVKGGTVIWSNVWLQPIGTFQFLAARTMKPTGALAGKVYAFGAEHYRLPKRGPLRFEVVQQKTEVSVTASTSEEAASKVGAKGTLGVDFKILKVGGEVSEERARKTGVSVAQTWIVIQPTTVFKIKQIE